MNAGYYDEARAWRDWLLRAAAGAPSQLQIMYGLAGERRLTEFEVAVAAGLRRIAPVRIGNAAHAQLQLDVFGEVMDALHQARRGGLAPREDRLGFPARAARAPRNGLGRAGRGHLGGARRAAHFTLFEGDGVGGARSRHSRPETYRLERPLDRWRALRDTIHARSARAASMRDWQLRPVVRLEGARRQPAAPADDGLSAADDPRIRGTIAAVERHLFVDGFVLRYDTGDEPTMGCPAGEGAFLACSFWLADAYVLIGRLDDARLFERLLSIRNDVGLLAEEYDTRDRPSGRQFPAGVLARRAGEHRAQSEPRRKPAEQRAGRQ